jgi:hypothetical protein
MVAKTAHTGPAVLKTLEATLPPNAGAFNSGRPAADSDTGRREEVCTGPARENMWIEAGRTDDGTPAPRSSMALMRPAPDVTSASPSQLEGPS